MSHRSLPTNAPPLRPWWVALLALCLSLQGLVVAVERSSSSGHVHLATAAVGATGSVSMPWARGLHALGGQFGALVNLLGEMPDTPMLVHASEHAAEHRHPGGIGHHHHEPDEPGVAYVADPGDVGDDAVPAGSGKAKRVLADSEALTAAAALPPSARSPARPAPADGPRFASRDSEPLERPPR